MLFLVTGVRRLFLLLRIKSLAGEVRDRDPHQVERAVGRVLGDPGFRIARWAGGAWLDASGSPVQGTGSVTRTIIPGHSPPMALFHDAAYQEDRDTMSLVIELVVSGSSGHWSRPQSRT
ncbi:hypothetical protein [Actinoplanes sp. NPDC049802]|uniref:hypothetical protein n=1 Tax=Actinoplanes sp. NPDC049802 TaxID=3154742 RepID=UPI0033E8A237